MSYNPYANHYTNNARPLGVQHDVRFATGGYAPPFTDLTAEEYRELDTALRAYDQAFVEGLYMRDRDYYVWGGAIAKTFLMDRPFQASPTSGGFGIQGIRPCHFSTRRSWRTTVAAGWNDMFEMQRPGQPYEGMFVIRSIAIPLGTQIHAPQEMRWTVGVQMYPIEVMRWRPVGEMFQMHDLSMAVLVNSRTTATCKMYFESPGEVEVQLIGVAFGDYMFQNWDPPAQTQNTELPDPSIVMRRNMQQLVEEQERLAAQARTDRMVQRYAVSTGNVGFGYAALNDPSPPGSGGNTAIGYDAIRMGALPTAPTPKPKPKKEITEEDLIVGSMADDGDGKDGTT